MSVRIPILCATAGSNVPSPRAFRWSGAAIKTAFLQETIENYVRNTHICRGEKSSVEMFIHCRMKLETASLGHLIAEVKLCLDQLVEAYERLDKTEEESRRAELFVRIKHWWDTVNKSDNARQMILDLYTLHYQNPQTPVIFRPLDFRHSIKHFEVGNYEDYSVLQWIICTLNIAIQYCQNSDWSIKLLVWYTRT